MNQPFTILPSLNLRNNIRGAKVYFTVVYIVAFFGLMTYLKTLLRFAYMGI